MIARFIRHSLIAFVTVAALLLSGSQNLPSYWHNWQQAQTRWQYLQPDCKQLQSPNCLAHWRLFLSRTMDYNREANQLPGFLWRRWLYPELPDCLSIPAALIPAASQLSVITSQRLCQPDERIES
ncbi:hypothetical protein [Oceanobacter mangrovi]|uniref:hypothetical protein n=1 Tax=Oceanobacter mangrovi TaxID=2862510 RepID=UPI001C8DF45A|nr:hypothetical protein [Oceanobacter mangrovi]